MREFSEDGAQLIQYVVQLDEDKVLELADSLLNRGMDPPDLLDLLNKGMNGVGKLYESQDYYIADLIMAGLIFKQVLELDKVIAHFRDKHNENSGRVVLGTVKGDIHDIGKDIFRGMLEANGFEVIDLGVDVPPELFMNKFRELNPDIVALSGVLSSTVDSMKETIDSFRKAGLGEQTKFIIGGNHLTKDTSKFIGADGFANDASTGVKLCLKWMANRAGLGVSDNG